MLLCLTSLCGCLSEHTERAADTDPSGWMAGDTVSVAVDNSDTILLRDISLFVRYDDSFRPQALPLSVMVTAPDSSRFSESITLHIDRDANSFTGHKEYSVPYRSAVSLNREGTYRFSFAPLTEEVEGICAIGIKISENQEPQ